MKKNSLFVYSLAWIAIWIIPWGKTPPIQSSLAFPLDMFRLGIALVAFIMPGSLLYLLLSDNDPRTKLQGILPIGFAFSMFLVAVIGLIGRLLGFSFTLVKYTFAFVGLIELVLLFITNLDFSLYWRELLKALHSMVSNAPLSLALVLGTLMTFHDHLFFVDDFSYLAYLTNWQRSTQLGFINVIHETGMMENVRFWLALYPMGQALLSDLSGVPGILLLSHYLELFLVPIAIITAFWFARKLGLSPKAAGFATLIQISLYTWMLGDAFPVGMWFYQNMAEDKVTAAFILSPVFFVFLLSFLNFPRRKVLFMILIVGIGLTLTHPVILFFSCLIACSLIFLFLVMKKTNLWGVVQLLVILVIILLPYVAVRFSDIPAKMNMPLSAESVSTTFQPERYVNVVNHIFYGLNPEVLKFVNLLSDSEGFSAFQIFRFIPIIIAAIGGLIALFKIKEDNLHLYVISSTMLVLFVALPYTGWLIGYAVTARVLPRASWYLPLGLSGVLVATLLRDQLKVFRVVDGGNEIPVFNRHKLTLDFLGISVCYLLAIPMLAGNILFQTQSFFKILDHNAQLAQIGNFIDENTKNMVTSIALDYADNQLLPGVSAHSYLISFREETAYNGFNNIFSIDEIHSRIGDSNAIRLLDNKVQPDERCAAIRKYDVRFVVTQQDNVKLFRSLLGECENIVGVAFETKDLILLEFIH